MNQIKKTNAKATYFKGNFYLRDNSKTDWSTPIDFPTVFTAYGAAIKSGNWKSCTGINTPKYVIDNYFNGKNTMPHFWKAVFALEKITWKNVKKDRSKILNLINTANNELLKLPTL